MTDLMGTLAQIADLRTRAVAVLPPSRAVEILMGWMPRDRLRDMVEFLERPTIPDKDQVRRYLLAEFEDVDDLSQADIIERWVAAHWELIFRSDPPFDTVDEAVSGCYVTEELSSMWGSWIGPKPQDIWLRAEVILDIEDLLRSGAVELRTTGRTVG